MSINIDELHRKRENRLRAKTGAYQEVLRICHNVIKRTASETNECHCFFVVPPMVYGYPLYDINACILYIVEKLDKNGLNVVYTHPNLLLISWYKKPEPPKKEIQLPPPKKKEIDYRPIGDYRPSHNFVNQDSLDSLKNRASRLLFEDPNF